MPAALIVPAMTNELRSVVVPIVSYLIPIFERFGQRSSRAAKGQMLNRPEVGPGTEVRLSDGVRYTHESTERFLRRLVDARLAIR
jgi:hypothetical protein